MRRRLDLVYIVAAALLALVATHASAQSDEPQQSSVAAQSQPTVATEPALRPLSPDRPDVTESPHSVDQGHFQLEMDMWASERDGGDPTLAFGVSNLKLGITSFMDFQLVLRPLVATDAPTGDARQLGYGDPVTRVKIALFGNDGGPFALGLLGFLRVPVKGSVGDVPDDQRAFEGGIVVPMGVELPYAFDLGAQVELDIAQNAALDGHHLEYLGSVALSHPIYGPLSFGLEGVMLAVVDDGTSIVATVNPMFVYEVHENFALDAGVYIGVTRDAPDLFSFVGTTVRI